MNLFTVIVALLATNHCSAKRWERIKERIRVGFLDYPPSIFTEQVNGKTVISGSLALLVEWVANHGNFTHEFVRLDYINRFNGLPQEFKEKNLNWAVTNWALSLGRNYLTDILFPYKYEEYVIIIPFPKREANIRAAVLPYTGEVWACAFSAMTVTILSLVWLSRQKRFLFKSTRADPFLSFHGSAMYVVGVATNQGASCFSKARSTRLVAGLWCLAAFVLVNAYSSSLITYMTIPSTTPLVRKIEDLANRSEPQILTRTDSFVRVLFETSARYQPYFGNAMKFTNKFCGSTYEEVEKCVNLVKKGGHVMAVNDILGAILLNRDYEKTGSCQLTLAEGKFEPGYSGTVMPLNSPHELRNRIDVLTLEAISYGLVDEWKRRFESASGPCMNYKSTSKETRSFSLKDFTSAFIIFGAGTACSCIAFAYELLSYRMHEKYKLSA